jgi:DNA repair exonuclease SbcCD nuclease subunit
MSLRIAVSGDWHLATCAWKSYPEVCGDAYSSAKQIVDYCVDKANAVDCLVLIGDVFDAEPPSDAAKFYIDEMKRLDDASVRTMAIQGQHGRVRSVLLPDDKGKPRPVVVPWTSIAPSVGWVHNEIQEMYYSNDHALKFICFDNLPADELEARIKAIPEDVSILFLHQMARGTVPEIEGHSNWDFDPAWVPSHVKLVMLGDYHAPWSKTVKHNNGETTIVEYTGSIAMQSVDEVPDKSFVVIDISGDAKNRKIVLERVKLNTRPFKMFNIQSDAELEQAIAEAKNMPPHSLIVVKFKATIQKVQDAFKAIGGNLHFMFKPTVLESELPDMGAIAKVSHQTMEQCLGQLLPREKDPALHSFVLSLLKGGHARSVIESVRKQHVIEVPLL